MTKETYSLLESYMLSCMEDSAHDKEHIYRVLYNALKIAESEDSVDKDVLISACLLHDIGRKEQFENPALCHAAKGAQKAYKFLIANGFSSDYAEKVRHCIETHRYRKNNPPQSIEAKILFDADKLEATGTIGIARTLFYKGKVAEPLYFLLPDGTVSDGSNDKEPSFFQEYKYKLENVYSRFYTKKGNQIAKKRQHAAADFYNSMFNEINESYKNGIRSLKNALSE